MNPAIQIQNIDKSYGNVKALNNIGFDVNQSELFGLIGPDGAGKTTLFRILTTLLIPDSGKAKMAGYDTVKDFKSIRQLVGYMPGRFSLYQDLSVEENLEFFATTFGTTIEKNYELIKDIYIQIEPFKKRLAGKLSGGMKQKLALSCALIHRPEILVLDEPTTGVDAVSRKEFWEMLINLKKEGITIIVSTPYMDEASLCDRVALIQNGEIMKIDKPDNIVHEFEKEIFAVHTKDFYKLLRDLQKYELTHSVYPFGESLHFISKNKEDASKQLEAYLKLNSHESIEIKRIKPNIEDVFMELMVRGNVESSGFRVTDQEFQKNN
jgi:ABC-type multidrug transport system ATPase subunit